MKVNLICCLFVLDSDKSNNVRKKDIKKIKVLVTKNGQVPEMSFCGNDMKKQVRENISTIIGTEVFHLEQVFTMDYENSLDVLYLGITNIDNIKAINNDYKLIEFKVKNNNLVQFGEIAYKYKTIELERYNNIEYIHEIDCSNPKLKRTLLNLLISYKKIRSNIDTTDIIFKFMGKTFVLEDVRMVYEIIKDSRVDKSNFRKKIKKYCEKVDEKEDTKKGYRPSEKYKFKPLKGDIWL